MASLLEQFVTTARTLTDNGDYKAVCDYLNKSNDILLKNTQHLDTILETLDIQQHSLAYLAVLSVKFNSVASSTQDNNKFIQAQEFINGCNGEQIRFAPDMFAEFCHSVRNYVLQKQSVQGILLMKKAIEKLRCYDSQLTSVHADLCQLCLLTKCFKPALDILDVDITGICLENPNNQSGSQFDAKYFLLYYYYGGMLYLAVRNLDRALYFFEVAITTPAHGVSHIMLEAYKKYILVSLLLHGKVLPVPKYASQIVLRFIRPLSQPYHDVANIFVTNNSRALDVVINKHKDVFVKDRNHGLAKQVAAVLYKKNIQRLTKTFLTLSLSDVANRVGFSGPVEAERCILEMIEDRQIFAIINQKDGMVVFQDEPDRYGGSDVLKNLEMQLALCMELDRQILEMDEEIQVNPVYVKKSNGVAQDEEQPSKMAYAV